MKEQHQELFVDLLIEKVESQKKRLQILELESKASNTTPYFIKRFPDEPVYNPDVVQETIGLYEERILELTKQCDEIYQQLGEKDEELAKIKSIAEKGGEAIACNIDLAQRLKEMEEQLASHDGESYDDLEARFNQLNLAYTSVCQELKEARKEKEDRRGMAAALTSYKLMVEYAKSQGFKFLRADKMKEIIQQTNSPASKSFEAPEGTTPLDFDTNHQAPCPYSIEEKQGHVTQLGGRYCRTKCPYYSGVDFDQKVIFCSKG